MKKNLFTRVISVFCALVCLIPLCSTVALAATDGGSGIQIDFDRAIEKLGWMAEGMLCILAVMLLLIVITTILNKVTTKRKK